MPPSIRQIVLLVTVTLSIPALARAEQASDLEIRQVCERWLQVVVNGVGTWAGSTEPRILDSREIRTDDGLAAICFSVEPRGFVLVSAIKEMSPIRAYSDESDLNWDDPNGLASVLATRVRVTKNQLHLQRSDVPVSDGNQLADNRSAWDRLTSAGAAGAASLPTIEVGPLLTTKWHQSPPYNNLCPIACEGMLAQVGCVATAGAQILKYHEWPPNGGTGAHEYLWDGEDCVPDQMLQADYSDPYDWDNMPEVCEDPGDCSSIEEAAIAVLCYETGVLFDMDYGYHGSGTEEIVMMEKWPVHLGYQESMVSEARSEHTSDSWFAMLQDEINALRPVMHRLAYSNPDHAGVCDGWRVMEWTNFVHMNYGWGSLGGLFWYNVNDVEGPFTINDSVIRHISPPHVTEVVVNPGGTGDYPTIQAAIDAVNDGVTILLADGVFTGSGNRDIDFHGKKVAVSSESGDPSLCIIDCQGTSSQPHRGFLFQSGEGYASVVNNVTIRNGMMRPLGAPLENIGGAVYCKNASSPLLKGCVFLQNFAAKGGAVGVVGTCVPFLDRCVFDRNAADMGGAVYCDNGATPAIRNATFYGNSNQPVPGAAKGASGIHSRNSSHPEISKSILAFSAQGPVVQCVLGGAMTFTCSDVYGNPNGDWIGCIASQANVNGNFSLNPRFCEASSGNLGLSILSPCANHEGCGLIGARGVECNGLVRPDGTGDWPTIQAAIDAVQTGAVISLANGVFTGTGNRDLDFNGKSLTVASLSGNPEACIIDCGGSAGNPHRGIAFESNDHNVILQEFTIRNGYQASGGAISSSGSSGLHFEGMIFEDNLATSTGGAANFNDTQDLLLQDCVIRGNTSQGVGGGVTVAGNGSIAEIAQCQFVENTAAFGGGLRSDNPGTLYVYYSVFLRNHGNGGAIHAVGSASTSVINCTMHANTTTGSGGTAVTSENGHVGLNSCLITMGGAGELVVCGSGGLVTLACCDLYENSEDDWSDCIDEWENTQGNFSADPLYCDAANDDFHLQPGSPCENAQNCGLIGAFSVDPECGAASPAGPPRDAVARVPHFLKAPNPFASGDRITLRFSSPRGSNAPIRVELFDVAGRLVRRLYDSTSEVEEIEIAWDGRGDSGGWAPQGIYFIRATNGEERLLRKVVFVR